MATNPNRTDLDLADQGGLAEAIMRLITKAGARAEYSLEECEEIGFALERRTGPRRPPEASSRLLGRS
jgi:hypothetical protein